MTAISDGLNTAGGQRDEPAAIDVAALFPADPDLMGSPEGDTKGLHELQEVARQRREELHP